jgi:putative sugar O-methyltransferase
MTTDLATVVSTGDVAAVRAVLDMGAFDRDDLNAALVRAAASGHADIVTHLVSRGADVMTDDGAALVGAAEGGHLHAVRSLHQLGADLNARAGAALCAAAHHGHVHVIRYLHDNGGQHHLLSGASAARIRHMEEEVRAARPVYLPAEIWTFLNGVNRMMLGFGGEENFKRTVNQNYFNFIPTSLWDPKIVNLVRLWLRHPTLAPLGYRIEDPDRDPRYWYSLDERYYVFRGKHAFRLRLYKWFVACLFEYVRTTDRRGLLDRLDEPELGNPIRVWRGRRLVSQDLANSVREWSVIADALSDRGVDATPRIAELGAGYGRLGYVALAASRARYFVFDIPPALYLSEWYLPRLFPQRTIFRFRPFRSFSEIADEVELADIAFFTPNQLELIPPRFFDAFVTISSLHEMRREQIQHFLGLMTSTTEHVLYVKQHRHYVNPWDGLHITRADYPLPPDWQIVREQPDVLNPGFFEFVAARRPERHGA